MRQDIFIAFFLVPRKASAIQELFPVLILVSYLHYQFGIHQQSSQHEGSGILLCETVIVANLYGCLPVFLSKIEKLLIVSFLNEEFLGFVFAFGPDLDVILGQGNRVSKIGQQVETCLRVTQVPAVTFHKVDQILAALCRDRVEIDAQQGGSGIIGVYFQ